MKKLSKQNWLRGLFVGLALSATAGTSFAANYDVDTKGAHAFINAKFMHLGYSVLHATFKTFGGSFSFDPDNLKASKVSINIDVASIDSNHAERDKHMRGEKFLHTDKYPTATFESTRIEPKGDNKFVLHGDLSLRGVKKAVAIDATLINHGKDPWGGYRSGFKGFVTLDMREFGVKTFVPMHTVDMELFIEGIKQK